MNTVFVIFLIIISLLLVLIVLVQNSKGGGLASNFAGSNQYMGVRKTADFLEKATWTLAASLLIFSLLATWTIPRQEEVSKSRIEGQFDNSRLNQPANSNTIDLPESGESTPTEAQPK
jgi:preprotein translocase subunit SecG